MLGIIPSMLACILGLSVLLHNSAMLFKWIKFIGVVYLLYLAWLTYKNSTALQLAGQATEISSLIILLRGCLVNVLNPKLSIFLWPFYRSL